MSIFRRKPTPPIELFAWAPIVDGFGEPSLNAADHGVRLREPSWHLTVGLDGVEAEAGALGYFSDTEVAVHAPNNTHESAHTKVLTRSTKGCILKYMSNDKMYTVKITSGFEQGISFAGKYETKAEAIAAARYMKAKGIRGGRYYLAVPA